MASTSGFNDLIRSIAGLSRSMDELKRVKQDVNVNISLTDKLDASVSRGGKLNILRDLSRSRSVPGETRERIASSLRRYQSLKRDYENSRKIRDQLQHQLQAMRQRLAGMPRGAPGSVQHASRQRVAAIIQQVQQVKQAASGRVVQQRIKMAQQVRQGVMAARGGLAAGASRGGMAVAIGRLNIAFTAATVAFKAASAVVSKAYGNLAHYGGYSFGGIQAQMTERLGDFFRNIRISQATSGTMQNFAVASQRMKNAIEPIQTAIAALTNRLGAGVLNVGAAVVEKANKALGIKGMSPEEAQRQQWNQLNAPILGLAGINAFDEGPVFAPRARRRRARAAGAGGGPWWGRAAGWAFPAIGAAGKAMDHLKGGIPLGGDDRGQFRLMLPGMGKAVGEKGRIPPAGKVPIVGGLAGAIRAAAQARAANPAAMAGYKNSAQQLAERRAREAREAAAERRRFLNIASAQSKRMGVELQIKSREKSISAFKYNRAAIVNKGRRDQLRKSDQFALDWYTGQIKKLENEIINLRKTLDGRLKDISDNGLRVHASSRTAMMAPGVMPPAAGARPRRFPGGLPLIGPIAPG